MNKYLFKQIDVFTLSPFNGNPVAVIFKADQLSKNEMQKIAAWINLSETVFIQTSTKADYLLRIFSPKKEVPFAGHPTIGSAHAIIEAGLIAGREKNFVLECKAGLIRIRLNDYGVITAQVPYVKVLATKLEKTLISDFLGSVSILNPALINVGPIWAVAYLDDFSLLYELSINSEKIIEFSRNANCVGITVYAIDERECVHVRSFAPFLGVTEDPVCGSGNAAVAAHIISTGLKRRVGSTYVAHQGQALGRNGYVSVQIDANNIFIGGHCKTLIEGKIAV